MVRRAKRLVVFPLVHPAQRGADLLSQRMQPDPSAPTKMEVLQAQQDGEFAGRHAAANISGFDLKVDESDTDGGHEVDMCDQIVKVAHHDIEGGWFLGMHDVPKPPKSTPLQSAYWAGFDWAVKRKFRCVCDPDDSTTLGGLRRNRKHRRQVE